MSTSPQPNAPDHNSESTAPAPSAARTPSDGLTSSAAPTSSDAPAPGGPVVLDREFAIEQTCGDLEFLSELLELFVADAANQMESMQGALSEGENDVAERNAHSIKGSAANIGALAVREVAQTLETMIHEGELEGVQPQIATVQTELDRFKEHVEQDG